MRNNPRNDPQYIRYLELISIITEEWGEAVKHLNKHIDNNYEIHYAAKALIELQNLHSPINELMAVLSTELTKKIENSEDEKN